MIEDSPIFAAQAAPTDATGEFMYMAGGKHEISCKRGAKDFEATILVDQSTAKVLEQQRKELSASHSNKPFFDFDHENGRASFHPKEFFWRDGPPGVYVRGTWTAAGRAAIEGRDYTGFSPQFHIDKARGTPDDPNRVICASYAKLSMGGLVNDPAFRKNLPLSGKHAGKPGAVSKTKNKKSMTDTEKAALEAKIQQTKTDIAALQSQDTNDATVAEPLAAKKNELELMESQLAVKAAEDRADASERENLVNRSEKAKDAVSAAVKRGALPTKDLPLQAAWAKKIVEDPSNLELLNKIPGSIALVGSNQQTEAVTGGRIIRSAMISRESSADVLRNMASVCARQGPRGGLSYGDKVVAAKELSALYAREITPRMKEGDDIPLMGANTLGTLAQTLVAIRTLELLTAQLPELRAVTTDFSDQIVSYGDTLKTRIVGIPTVATFNTTTGWATPSPVTTTDVSITYNQFKGVPIQFLGHEVAGTMRRLFDELAPAQAWALGDNMVTYVLALITAAAFTNTATTAGVSVFARPDVIDMGTALRKRGVPAGSMNRALLLNSDFFGALAKDPAIVSLAAYQKADIITDGILPNVHGFRVIDCPTMPATSISGGTLAGIGMSRSALVIASRLSADYVNAIPGAGNGNLTVVTTPAGFSANLVQFVDHVGATANSRLEVIYGASAGQGNAGQLLLAP